MSDRIVEVVCVGVKAYDEASIPTGDHETILVDDDVWCELRPKMRLFDVDFKLMWLKKYFKTVCERVKKSPPSCRRIVFTKTSPLDAMNRWDRRSDPEAGKRKCTEFIHENVERLFREHGIVMTFITSSLK